MAPRLTPEARLCYFEIARGVALRLHTLSSVCKIIIKPANQFVQKVPALHSLCLSTVWSTVSNALERSIKRLHNAACYL